MFSVVSFYLKRFFSLNRCVWVFAERWGVISLFCNIWFVCVLTGLSKEQTPRVEPRVSGLSCRYDFYLHFLSFSSGPVVLSQNKRTMFLLCVLCVEFPFVVLFQRITWIGNTSSKASLTIFRCEHHRAPTQLDAKVHNTSRDEGVFPIKHTADLSLSLPFSLF